MLLGEGDPSRGTATPSGVDAYPGERWVDCSRQAFGCRPVFVFFLCFFLRKLMKNVQRFDVNKM